MPQVRNGGTQGHKGWSGTISTSAIVHKIRKILHKMKQQQAASVLEKMFHTK